MKAAAAMLRQNTQILKHTYSDVNNNQWQCDELNSQVVECTDGYECNYCHNKGIYYRLDNIVEVCSAPCPECGSIRKSIRLFAISGLDKLTFEGFRVTAEWQGKLLALAREYVSCGSGQWFFIGGQSGAGKTHICSAIIHEVIFTYHKPAIVFHWVEEGRRLKSLVNSEADYEPEIDRYKKIPILYIDDFFKVKKGEKISSADVRLAFEIINHRYNDRLRTIISCEKTLHEILEIDEALGGRIRQMSGKYAFGIKSDSSKNYRFTV